MKEEIFKCDEHKCVVYHKWPQDGVERQVQTTKFQRTKGADNSVENGQTLCMEHNLMKKNYSQTEAGLLLTAMRR